MCKIHSDKREPENNHCYHPRVASATGSKRAWIPIPEQSKRKVAEKVFPFLDSVMGSQASCGLSSPPPQFAAEVT